MSYRHTRSALAAAILATLASQTAQAVQTIEAAAPQVVVSATRFAEADPRVPANITVISREEIAASPSLGLPDLLKSAAGIEVRSLYGNMGIDAAVDLRGFGDTGTSNTLVLLDGRRLNPIDLSAVSWSSIPLGNVERVEIIRGSGSVLFGDRASGGVINIITDKSSKPQSSVAATVGSYGYVGLDASTGAASDSGRFTINGHFADGDGWRRNSDASQQSISGRGALKLARGEAFMDYVFYDDRNGLPGYLPTAQYRDDPRQILAKFSKDKQRRDGYLVRPGLALELTPSLALEVELAADHENYHADNVSFASVFQRRRDMLSLTPRLRWNHGLGNMASQTVVGIDYYDGDVASRSTTYAAQGAKQQST
ncbi:MAG TPA: TonB-dependent receptor plug domain-containing protein, partial [Rhodocyclaceae bacterium]